MTENSFETLRLENRDGVLFVTISRPKVLNALNARTLDEIERAFTAARDDDAVRAIVITGEGEKAFVAGADIGELSQLDAGSAKRAAERGQRAFRTIETMPKPVIAAVNGFALGGGCELALACHIRIASENAQIGLPEVTLGVIPGYGGTQRLARLVGRGKALEMILTGDRISAADAERAGLFNAVVPLDRLLSTAEEMARKIASRAPLAVAAAIDSVDHGLDVPLGQGLSYEAALFGVLFSTSDAHAGINAFLEKRKVTFEGK